MKITLLTASLRGGGAERVQITLAQEFHKRGHDVTLLSMENDGELRELISETIRVRYLNVSRVLKGILPLARYLRRAKPDNIIAGMTHVGIAAFIAKKLARWDGILVIRIDGSRRFHKNEHPIHKRFVLDAAHRLIFPRVNAMIAVSTDIAREFQEDFGLKNCHVIHNPVSSNFGTHKITEDCLNSFFEKNTPVIIGIGRLNKQKGFDFLLKVFATLRAQQPAKLLILGEGEERQHLENIVTLLHLEDDVSLPGFVPNPFSYLKRSSVYALSSQNEPFGLSLVEALSVGLPIVATSTQGPQDIITSSSIGEIVEYGDVKGFASALARALDATFKNRKLRISRAADFAPELIATKYLHLIKDNSKK